jgi:hypothetical protein
LWEILASAQYITLETGRCSYQRIEDVTPSVSMAVFVIIHQGIALLDVGDGHVQEREDI